MTDISCRLPAEEVNLLRRWHPNVLITGAPAATGAAVEQLTTCFRSPIETRRAGEPLNLSPVTPVKTLVLADASSMSADEQQRLLNWLQHNQCTTQVITMSPVPLYDLVYRGDFLESLYYYLNAVHFDLV